MKNIITKEMAELYRRSLPRGYQKKIAEELGVSHVSVSRFLARKNGSRRIENAILRTMEELEAERSELLKKAGLK